MYADSSTLPSEVLKPNFTGNADFIDTDDVFAPVISRREMWIGGFPVLERPSDRLVNIYEYITYYIIVILYYRQCLFTREYIRTSLKAAEVHTHCYVYYYFIKCAYSYL